MAFVLDRSGDFFSLLGVPRKLDLDLADLERKFRALSREVHPDFFYNAPPAERRASLERTSRLNDAYRTLKSPAARLEYLLCIEAVSESRDRHRPGALSQPTASPELLEQVFELNEQLDEVRQLRARGAPDDEWRARLERARKPIDDKRVAHEKRLRELSTRWDSLADAREAARAAGERRALLGALRECMLERNYINNLLATIDREAAAP